MTVHRVVVHHCDDFVVRLIFIDRAQAADRNGLYQQVAVADGFLGEHANVHRIAVALDAGLAGALFALSSDALGAQRARQVNRTVTGRCVEKRCGRSILSRPAAFVELLAFTIVVDTTRCNAGDGGRGLGADFDAMPGMGTKSRRKHGRHGLR